MNRRGLKRCWSSLTGGYLLLVMESAGNASTSGLAVVVSRYPFFFCFMNRSRIVKQYEVIGSQVAWKSDPVISQQLVPRCRDPGEEKQFNG
ncbi:hypothetical protein F4775DRAFT_548549 [Biscogniauxia sp. FL1348]|nr:hypothetical protein F4775DRAFT_548549 [Biscogniauxia sp. FL1348]